MSSACSHPLANRWYDRLLRLCVLAYGLAAAVAMVFAMHLLALAGATAPGGQGLLRFPPALRVTGEVGGVRLAVDGGLVLLALFQAGLFVLLGVLAVRFYKSVRLRRGGQQVRLFERRAWLRLGWLIAVYWLLCWLAAVFGEGASADQTTRLRQVFLPLACAVLVVACAVIAKGVLMSLRGLWRDWRRPPFTANAQGADIIRRFATGRSEGWEWDDFTSATQSNPEVKLAVALCEHLACKYLARHKREYCRADGLSCFLEVADALEQGLLAGVAFAESTPAESPSGRDALIKTAIGRVAADKAWWEQFDRNAAPGELLPWLRGQSAVVDKAVVPSAQT